MSDYQIDCATKEEWAQRAFNAEAKLAKAVEALEQISKPKVGPDFDWSEEEVNAWKATWYRKYGDMARDTLKQIGEGLK